MIVEIEPRALSKLQRILRRSPRQRTPMVRRVASICFGGGVDFVVAVVGEVTLFEALQSGGRGEGDTGGGRGGLAAIGTQRFSLVTSHGQEWVNAEGGVVVEVVVAHSVAEEPLGQEFAHGVSAITLGALVGLGLGEPGGEAQAGIDMAQ